MAHHENSSSKDGLFSWWRTARRTRIGPPMGGRKTGTITRSRAKELPPSSFECDDVISLDIPGGIILQASGNRERSDCFLREIT